MLSHIKACFESPAEIDRLIIVTATKTKLKELKKTVQSDLIFTAYADRIAFDVIENYMMTR